MDASSTTLYSGGLKGTEATFGELAEKWGLTEVTFSYEGNKPVRERGLQVLSAEDLKKGDISMEIVSLRMHRSYSKAEKIRKVFQTIFHMVNKGFQVVAVGWIQPDQTVKGGTGWAVELAKLFNRPLSVYDQERDGWFDWVNHAWEPSTPTITSETFVGTGTRNLSEAGATAIADLYQRSFGN